MKKQTLESVTKENEGLNDLLTATYNRGDQDVARRVEKYLRLEIPKNEILSLLTRRSPERCVGEFEKITMDAIHVIYVEGNKYFGADLWEQLENYKGV